MIHESHSCKPCSFLLLVALLLTGIARAESPFTYQGQLTDAGTPHNGTAEMIFRLWDADTGGTQIGGDLNRAVEVTDGLFQAVLDFGSVFDGSFRYLEIEVDGTVLQPRQRVLPVPMALMALDVPGQFWRQGGNAGTGPGDFLGTTDTTSFEIHVDGLRTLRIEPSGANEEGPNIIAGDQANHATAGIIGATIAGGGYTGGANQVSADYASIGGGEGNSAGGSWSTIGGGIGNTTGGGSSTIAGGSSNTTTEIWSTVGGGSGNTASGSRSTVPGGSGNESGGTYSFAAGRRAKAMHDGTFVWADATDADFSSASANEYAARASGGVRWAVGNGGWQIRPSGATDEAPNVIAGHATNEVSAGIVGATISGGGRILGSSIQSNSVTLDYSVVSGGVGNRAHGPFATTGGGRENYAAETYSTVGGGRSNTAENMAATVGGGNGNLASGWRSTVAGGYNNSATATNATVNGGESNNATGPSSAIPGGVGNTAAGDFSLAAGRRAQANHDGTFVWADATDANFTSAGVNQFIVRANGGAGFGEPPSDYFVINTPFGLQDTDYSFGTGALRVRINGATRFRVLGNGGVAIGNSYQTSGVPERGMRVSGVVELASLGTGGTEDLCRNTSDGAIATCSSSRRYKEDIRELDVNQTLLEQLRPVSFRWIDSGSEDIGLIAEEVAEIDPRLVSLNAEGRIEGVRYRQLNALLIRALQEQRKEAARMQSEITALQTQAEQLDELTEHNARLEARLLQIESLLSEPAMLALEK